MIWKPDTCKCVLEYNGSNDPANFTGGTLCPFHQTDSDSSKVLEENTRKNKALGELAKEPKLQKDAFIEGKIEKVLDESLVSWSFDENRELIIDVPTLTLAEKTKVLGDLSKISPEIKFK